MKLISTLIIVTLIGLEGISAYAQNPFQKPIDRFDKPTVFSIEKGLSQFRSQSIRPERAHPVIFNDLIYNLSSRKILVAFDFSGEKRLEHKLTFSPVAGFIIDDTGLIYVGGDDGKFHCLRAISGEEVWSHDQKAIDFSEPLIYQDLVIFQTGRDLVLALDKNTGEWKWEYQHLRPDSLSVRSLCPPVVKDGVLYIGLSAGYVAALNVDTGRLIWKSRAFRGEQFTDVDAPLEIDESTVYASSVAGQMAALSRKTGKVYWRYEGGGMAGLRLANDMVYLATDQGELVSMDKVTGKVRWTTELPTRSSLGSTGSKLKRFMDLPTRPVVIGESVITVTRGGKVIALDFESGKISKTYNYYTDTSTPAVALADGSGFLIMDNRGVIRLFRLKSD